MFTNLQTFVASVNAHALTKVQTSNFDLSQRTLLTQTVSHCQGQAAEDSHAQPLGLLHLVARAWNATLGEHAKHVATFCFFYLCSGDLFDDVQDNDLAGKPHELTGPPIAINNAIALMFLAFDELHRAIATAPSAEHGARYLAAFNRASLIGVACQHGDLMGQSAAETPEEVLALHQGKASSVALFMELGALLSGCEEAVIQQYRRAGESLACIVQIVDDLRDVYAKTESPDLANDKRTYPLACFLRDASDAQKQELLRLRAQLPESLPAIRQLFYDAGTIQSCADTLEVLRTRFHVEIANTGNTSAAHRLLLTVVDTLVSSIYSAEPIAETRHLLEPRGGFHDLVLAARDNFIEQMNPSAAAPTPRLVAWHLPHFSYDPDEEVIYYPDVDGLPEEVLPFYCDLVAGDFSAATQFLRHHISLCIAHEMFHAWRHERGRLSDDHWHEEYAANRLLVAFGREVSPATLASLLSFGAELTTRFDVKNHAGVQGILARCRVPAQGAQGYGIDQRTATALHFAMIQQIAASKPNLAGELSELLGLGTSVAAAAE